MKRADKIKKRQERSLRRKMKKIDELKSIVLTMDTNIAYDNLTFKQARQIVRHGHTFKCEMGYPGCERRGYCNGDC